MSRLNSKPAGDTIGAGDTALIITAEGDMNLRCPDTSKDEKVSRGTLLLMAVFHALNTDKALQQRMLRYFDDNPQAAAEFGMGRFDEAV
jgi:hypothetical protein